MLPPKPEVLSMVAPQHSLGHICKLGTGRAAFAKASALALPENLPRRCPRSAAGSLRCGLQSTQPGFPRARRIRSQGQYVCHLPFAPLFHHFCGVSSSAAVLCFGLVPYHCLTLQQQKWQFAPTWVGKTARFQLLSQNGYGQTRLNV